MSTVERVSSQRSIITGTVWNLLGRGLPMLVTLVMTPILIGELGLERWGLFTLGLALTGMAGVLDLGIGPALTRAVAERIGLGREGETPDIIVAAVVIVTAVSSLAAAVVWLAMPAIIDGLLPAQSTLRDEAVIAFRLLTLAVPAIVLSSTLWGALAAYQLLRAGNLLSIPLNAASTIVIALVLLVWNSLIPVMALLVLSRIAVAAGFCAILSRQLPGLRRHPRLRYEELPPLLRMGSWSSVATITGWIVAYGDRVLVGTLRSLVEVSYYATPLDLVMRLGILPVAISTPLTPAIAAALASRPEHASTLLQRCTALLFGEAVCITAVLVCFAPELLSLWLGVEFSAASAGVLRLLAIGIFFNHMTVASGAMIFGAGRFDLDSKLALVQLLFTVPASVALIVSFGIEGAAAAFVLRQICYFVLQWIAAARLNGDVFHFMRRTMAFVCFAGLALFLCTRLESLPARGVAAGLALVLLPPAVAMLMHPRDRLAVHRGAMAWFGKLSPRATP